MNENDLAEAKAYLEHPVLGKNIREIFDEESEVQRLWNKSCFQN